jgi:hypothetical protein
MDVASLSKITLVQVVQMVQLRMIIISTYNGTPSDALSCVKFSASVILSYTISAIVVQQFFASAHLMSENRCSGISV